MMLFAEAISYEKVKLQLQWKYQFQFAGFIVAKERGYYKDVGLDVEILEYNNGNSIKELEEGKIDFALNNSLLSFSENKLDDVTLLATYFQRSPLVIVTQKDIKSILDLKGKKIMMSENNRYNSSLSILLDYFRISSKNVTFLEPSFNLEDFIEKKVDAMTVFRSNELFELDRRSIPYNVIDPIEHDFSTNAINLFASHKKVENNPEQIHRFLSATKKGWEYALKNSSEVAKIIHEKYQANISVEHLEYEAKVTKNMMLTELYDIGEVNEEFVLKTYAKLLSREKINKDQSSDKLFFKSTMQNINVEFSKEEKDWIRANKFITFTGDPNWLPYEAFETNGKYIGVVADYVELIEKYSGLNFKKIPVKTWSESLQKATFGEVQMISGDAADKILNEKFKAIKPYSHNPIVIIMDMKNHYVESLELISDKNIAIIKDYGYTADIYKLYPNIKFIEVENIQEGLLGVSDGKYDAMLSSMALGSYTIAEMGMHNLKIVGQTPIVMDLTLFVSNDEPLLFSIIDKTLQSISQEQRTRISQKWIKHKYVEVIDYTVVFVITAFSCIILLLVFFWMLRLKQEVEKRKKAEEEYQYLYDYSSEMLISVDVRTRKIINCNTTLVQRLGYTKEEVLNQEVFRFYDEGSLDKVKEAFSLFLKTGKVKNADLTLKSKSGEKIDILLNVAAKRDKNGTIIHSFATWTDITEMKKSQRDLKSTHDKLAVLYELSPLGIVLTDMDGKYIESNNAFKKICGYDADELKALDAWVLTPKKYAEDEEKKLLSLKDTGHYGPYEKEYIRKDGNLIPINLNGMLIENSDGNSYIWSIVEDISSRKEHESALEYIAHYDSLTDLPNRVLFSDRLQHVMKQTKRNDKKVVIAYLDLDGFKEVNDSYGHDIGDELLKQISQRMISTIREEDSIARLGGDEFVVLLDNFNDIDDSIYIVERLLQVIEEPIIINDLSLHVSASIGLTFYPQEEDVTADQLLRQSDQAMYQAKLLGKNRFYIFNAAQDRSIRGHHESLDRIKLGLQNNEFVLYYQPKVNLRTGELIGLEALIRWQHPEKGLLAPIYFLPSIEKHVLEIELGEYVIKKAFSQMKDWKTKGLDMHVSINIAANHIEQNNFTQRLQEIMSEYPNIAPTNIELEVLETTSIENMSHVSNTVSILSELGIKFSLDDFGTGYSSLTYLKRLPVQTLKIDQSFVRDMLDDPEDFAIIDGVIGLAQAFNRKVIAEGMEKLEHAEILLRLGCDQVQGYAISKPMPPSEVGKWINTWKPQEKWKDIQTIEHSKLPILYASVEHRFWIKNIENLLNGIELNTGTTDKHACRFGNWLNSFKLQDDYKDIVIDIELLHDTVHSLANEILELHKQEKKEEAKKKLHDLFDARDSLLSKLDLLLESSTE